MNHAFCPWCGACGPCNQAHKDDCKRYGEGNKDLTTDSVGNSLSIGKSISDSKHAVDLLDKTNHPLRSTIL